MKSRPQVVRVPAGVAQLAFTEPHLLDEMICYYAGLPSGEPP